MALYLNRGHYVSPTPPKTKCHLTLSDYSCRKRSVSHHAICAYHSKWGPLPRHGTLCTVCVLRIQLEGATLLILLNTVSLHETFSLINMCAHPQEDRDQFWSIRLNNHIKTELIDHRIKMYLSFHATNFLYIVLDVGTWLIKSKIRLE